MVADPVSITGFILQCISQIIQFSNDVRIAARIPQDMISVIEELKVESEKIEKVSVEIQRILLEANVMAGAACHPSLESTLCRARFALAEAFALLGKWATRMGLEHVYNDALEKRGEYDGGAALTDPAARRLNEIQEGKHKFCMLMTKNLKVLWNKMRHVSYGRDEIKEVLEKLRRHDQDLTTLSAGLPFHFSSRLRGLDKTLKKAWSEGLKDPEPMPSTNNSIHVNFFDKSTLLTHSYDTRMGILGAAKDRIIVVRDEREIPRDSSSEVLDRDLTNLKWIAKMLGTLKAFEQCQRIGLLPCEGFFTLKEGSLSRYLSFKIPPVNGTKTPRTLRHCLVNMPMPALTDRVRIAQTLVSSVVALHTLGIVHRFLRPESAIVFPHVDDPNDKRLGDLYLLGFSQSRGEKGKSGNATYEDDEFRTDLYTHFEIHANPRRPKYTTKHDIFSLGVCLLEIALWRSVFIEYKDATRGTEERDMVPQPDDLVFDKQWPYADLDTEVIVEELKDEWTKDFGKAGPTSSERSHWAPDKEKIAHRRREHLVACARKEIPPLMGQEFCNAVVKCLEIDLLQVKESESESSTEEQILPASSPSPDAIASALSEKVALVPGTPDSLASGKTLVNSPSSSNSQSSSKESTPRSSKVHLPSKSSSPVGGDRGVGHSSSSTLVGEGKETIESLRKKTVKDDKERSVVEEQQDYLDTFLRDLMDKQKSISTDTVHSVVVARHVLQTLEKIHL